jgi:hypothetical protein
MGYQKIKNLYAEKDVLLMRELYAMEKIHGSSAHVSFEATEAGGAGKLHFFAGGCKQESFVAIFDHDISKMKDIIFAMV